MLDADFPEERTGGSGFYPNDENSDITSRRQLARRLRRVREGVPS